MESVLLSDNHSCDAEAGSEKTSKSAGTPSHLGVHLASALLRYPHRHFAQSLVLKV